MKEFKSRRRSKEVLKASLQNKQWLPPPKSESQAMWLPSYGALVPEKFSRKFKLAGKPFLQKNVGCIMEAKPGQAYKVLKRMRPRPGDNADYGSLNMSAWGCQQSNALTGWGRLSPLLAKNSMP